MASQFVFATANGSEKVYGVEKRQLVLMDDQEFSLKYLRMPLRPLIGSYLGWPQCLLPSLPLSLQISQILRGSSWQVVMAKGSESLYRLVAW
ncbi:uncharacterized protein G2W53_027222 [Senna tora]|uniref:Uncharacterized protein n=1 Tax=Senna tora TaxID=362788 RepID=A0A834WGD0_9FABA|nr:uncharacterized protein G2W53_027222 [Senna tora]